MVENVVNTLYEFYNTGDDNNVLVRNGQWFAQTFTPSTSHTITSVKLLLERTGTPGTVTIGIRATDGSGKPTGSDLATGITDADTLPGLGGGGEWREITLGDGASLSAGTKYAIVVRDPDSVINNRLYWRGDATSPTYTDGSMLFSLDSGSTWTANLTFDLMFEEWSETTVFVPSAMII